MSEPNTPEWQGSPPPGSEQRGLEPPPGSPPPEGATAPRGDEPSCLAVMGGCVGARGIGCLIALLIVGGILGYLAITGELFTP